MAMNKNCRKNGFWIAVCTLIAALMISGCTGKSQPTRFYSLAATAEGRSGVSEMAGGHNLIIGIGPVNLADYLSQSKIITRPTPHRIDRAEFDQWSGSFSNIVTNVLAENIGRQIGTEKIVLHPWRNPVQVDYQVVVDISRFDGRPGRSVILSARWALIRPAEKSVVSMRTSAFEEPITSSGYEGLAAAKSRALEQLSAEIAQAIAAAQS